MIYSPWLLVVVVPAMFLFQGPLVITYTRSIVEFEAQPFRFDLMCKIFSLHMEASCVGSPSFISVENKSKKPQR